MDTNRLGTVVPVYGYQEEDDRSQPGGQAGGVAGAYPGRGMHLKDLRTGPHPLVADQAVARALGQDEFTSASGVSALLRAAADPAVVELQREIREDLAPVRGQILSAASAAPLVADFDLTSLVVSDQATIYEGAEFGHMSTAGGPGKRYLFARAQVQSPDGSYVLGGLLHPGKTVSVH